MLPNLPKNKLMKLKNKLVGRVDSPMSIDPWIPGHLRDL